MPQNQLTVVHMLMSLHCSHLLCLGLQVNTTLTHLELSGNVIDYDGITALSEALTDNQALHSLHIKSAFQAAVYSPTLSMLFGVT